MRQKSYKPSKSGSQKYIFAVNSAELVGRPVDLSANHRKTLSICLEQVSRPTMPSVKTEMGSFKTNTECLLDWIDC